jgi:hypothetical protein
VRGQTLSALTLTVFTISPAVLGQSPEPPQTVQMKIDDITDRMNKAEAGLVVRMRMYHPIMEVYIQNLVPDEQLGWSPSQDEYFLGQFDLGENAPRLRPLSQMKRSPGLLARLPGAGKGAHYLPDGFAAMAAPDWRLLDRGRYEFKFVRREFLGEARCYVFDVKPRRGSEGFSGRIWIEDRDYNIVRFNGINRGTDQMLSTFFRRRGSFHVDGWRVNVLPGVWLPSSVYCEETDLSDARASGRQVRFKSQVRIWGYEAQSTDRTQELTTILIDKPSAIDATEAPRQLSPVLSQRRWEQEAEANVIERLEGVGLLAPAGEVDTVLETVLNNLIVTNGIVLERPLRCRVLLTSPLESFTVGRTIVLSRGLIDVLPDEASLATMLSHELSHVVLGHPLIDTKFAFADRLMIGDGDLLQTLQFHHAAREETAADEKVIEILEKSPYKDRLSDTGLFLRVIAQQARVLPRLIQPHIGDQIHGGRLQRVAALIERAPALAPERLDQIPALPLGTRVMVDPWSGRLRLDRSPTVPIASIREKAPLAVTPLMPYITYAEQGATVSSSR